MKPASLAPLMLATSLVACVGAGSEEAEEDAVADAADGKLDGLTLPAGLYTADDVAYEEGEPLVGAFSARDADTPRGETGYFDLVRHDYDVPDYGYYKLYTYRGRNRIRFTDEDGNVVLRTDWSYDSGTLVLGADGEMTRTSAGPEDLIHCGVTEIIDSEFEESLSATEYPMVGVSRTGDVYEMSIGASSWESGPSGIVIETEGSNFQATIDIGEGERLRIRVPNEAPRRGEVLAVSADDSVRWLTAVVCQ
jgi:hypothetical protein